MMANSDTHLYDIAERLAANTSQPATPPQATATATPGNHADGTAISFPVATLNSIIAGDTNLICARYSDGKIIDGYLVETTPVTAGTDLHFTHIPTGHTYTGTYRHDGCAGLYRQTTSHHLPRQ